MIQRILALKSQWSRSGANHLNVDGIHEEVGEMIREALDERDLPQSAIVKRLDVTPSLVNGIINGKQRATLDMLVLMSHVLGYDVKVEFVPRKAHDENQYKYNYIFAPQGK